MVKMKRKIISSVLAVSIMITLAGCGEKASNSSSKESSAITSTSSNTSSIGKKVTITVGSVGASNAAEEALWPWETVNKLEELTGITFKQVIYTDEKFKIQLTAGDLPDILNVKSEYAKQLIDGDLIIPMDNLLKTNGQAIEAVSKARIDFMKSNFSNDTGKLYFIPTQTSPGTPVSDVVTSWNGYIVRWDYYKELGYPQFKTDKEFLQILSQMQQKHPKTKDGKKTYAFGMWNDWGLGQWSWRSVLDFGYTNLSANGYVQNSQNQIINNYTDVNGPQWNDLKFYNSAYRMGMFDPDSFTMKLNDYTAKATAGQYLSSHVDWFVNAFYTNELKTNPNSISGYVMLPIEGTYSVAVPYPNKIGNTGNLFCITKNSPNSDRAMDLINAFNDPDIVRLFMSGFKGIDYNIIDGKMVPTKTSLDAKALNDDKWKKRGVGFGGSLNFLGINVTSNHPKDGMTMNIFGDPASVDPKTFTPVQKDYNTYYKSDYPYQAFSNLIKQNKAYDSKVFMPIGMAMKTTPEDIKRIDVKLDNIITKAIPKVIMTKSDDAFNTEMNKVLKELKDAGADEAFAWWKTEFEASKVIIEKMK